jgi:hypothetical protein
MTLSQRQYAIHRGTSEGAVRKAIKAGRISVNADGKIDPAMADQQWTANTDPSKQRKRKGRGKKANALKKKKVPKAAFDAIEKTLQEHDVEASDSLYMKAKTAQKILKAKMGKIELRILKGELIDRNKAMAAVFKLARSERDAWINWPARVSSQYAAEHALYTALTRSIRKHLQTLSEEK